MTPSGKGEQLRLLLGHELRRAGAEVRRPRPGAWAAVGLPLFLVAAALAAAGSSALPDPDVPSGAIGLAFLASAPIAFAGYGILFRARDDGLLRRLGFTPRVLFAVRALRLTLFAAGLVMLLLLPFATDLRPIGRPVVLLAAAAAAAVGAALLALSHAAALTARPCWRPGPFSRMMGMDPELVQVGPLVYAPLAPLAAALAVGGWLGGTPGVPIARFTMVLVAAASLAAVAARRFAQAQGRFAPRAQEIAYAPPPEVGETGLALDRGIARLLPIRSRAVLARDSRIVERRFRWSTSIVWPVAIVAVIALARWGEVAAVRSWVLGAGVLTLLVQGVALIALGRLEAAGGRWIDHAAGLRARDRWVGRAAYGFGISLWLTIPLGLAWGLWAGVGSGWAWLAAGALAALVSAGASMSASRRWR
jgi:hypothetical protein